jgi:hypothetical protein
MCGRSERKHTMTKMAADRTWPIACHTLTLSLRCTKIVVVLGDNSVLRGTSLLFWTVRKIIKLPRDFEGGVLEVPPDGMARPDNARSNDSWIRHATRCMLPHWAVDNSLLIWTRSVRADLYHPAARQLHRNIRDVICSSSRTVNCMHALNEKEKERFFENVTTQQFTTAHKVVLASFWPQTFAVNTSMLLVAGN